MTEAHPDIIIVKRHSAHEEEHHGGAWKIAFADFMTAMMAFFSGLSAPPTRTPRHSSRDTSIR
jgi:flagellar motor protein MotB